MTATVIYEGDLRCKCVHLQSGTEIETDAPTDNKGKGERFSPTDMLCVSLVTCMITTMGIRVSDKDFNLKNTKIEVTKHMLSEPRRIGSIEIDLYLPGNTWTNEDKEFLVKTGDNCPVMKSIHPDIKVEARYHWGS